MKNLKINKTLNFNDESIKLNYEGIPLKKDIDLEKTDKLLNDFMQNKNHKDMVKNISFIRTILKDYNEKSITFLYQDKNCREFIKYENSDLTTLEKEEKKDDDFKYKITYKPDCGINLNYNEVKTNMKKSSNVTTTSEKISDIMNHIYRLQNVSKAELNMDGKTLIEVYKQFYGKNPNFSDKNISTEVQTMVSILAEFDIDMNYSFINSPRRKMPLSLALAQLIEELYPFGEIDDSIQTTTLSDYAKNVIKIVGENVKDATESTDDKFEALRRISQVIYTARYNLSSNASINEICTFTNRTSDEVKSSMQLVKTIENKINKQL